MKLQILALSALLLGASQAAIVTTGAYSFDFGTTAANASPFFTDTTGNGHNITTNQQSTVSAATTPSASAAAATITNGAPGGIYNSAVPYAYTSDWAATVWVRANLDTAGVFLQGDNAGSGAAVARSGGNFVFSGQATTVAAAVGVWNQVTLINYGGTMTYFVNQVRVGTGVSTTANQFNSPMFNFGAGGNNPLGSSSYDEMKVIKFDSATDSLQNVQAALGVPEPTVALLGGLGALALLRRRRA